MNATCDAFFERSYSANDILKNMAVAPRPTYSLNVQWSDTSKDSRSSLPAAARVKVMSLMTSLLTIDEGIRDISELFFKGALSEDDSLGEWIGTSLVVSSSRPTENIERTKERLLTQVSEHKLRPVSYQLKDRTKIIEFLAHSSRLVCAFDDEGVQLLWRTKDESRSEIIRNDVLNFGQVLQKIAGILTSPSSQTIIELANDNSYALAC